VEGDSKGDIDDVVSGADADPEALTHTIGLVLAGAGCEGDASKLPRARGAPTCGTNGPFTRRPFELDRPDAQALGRVPSR